MTFEKITESESQPEPQHSDLKPPGESQGPSESFSELITSAPSEATQAQIQNENETIDKILDPAFDN